MTARAISTIWRWATLRVRIGAAGSIGRVERAQRFGRRPLLRRAIDEKTAEPLEGMTEEHVLRDRQFGDVLQFLVDHRDAGAAGGDRSMTGNALAVDLDMPLGRLVEAGKNAQQRGFASTILAKEPMHRTPRHRHGDAVERADRPEALADIR